MPVIDYHATLNVLVAVRGHPFDRTAFDAMFQQMEGITATMVDQPAASQLMNPQGMEPYHALVLYDMPGLDFSVEQNRPAYIAPDDALCAGFTALLEQGKGIVALHHALAGWPAWPDYASHLGGSFLYRSGSLRSVVCRDSGYCHDIDYIAEVTAPLHPVMHNIPQTFSMHDELYLAEVFEDSITPLLRARHEFSAAGFHSAAAAMGDGGANAGPWSHRDGSNLIGWSRKAGNSNLVYLQPGHDQATYNNPNYRNLVANAIRWVAVG